MVEFNEDGTVVADTTLTIWHYDEDTGLLLGSQEEFLPIGTGTPAHSTYIEPSEPREGFFQIWTGSWTYVEDNTGKEVWNTQTKEKSIITYIGPIKDGFTTIKPGEHDAWNGTKWVTDQEAIDQATVEANTQEKTKCNAEANHWISVLTDATDPDVMGEDILPEDVELLKQWKAYRVKLSRVTDMLNPVWPTKPAN